jgi:hypothetical protein
VRTEVVIMMVLLIVIGIALLITMAAVPFLLPWPQHVRWLIATSSIPDPWSLGALALDMREVRVGAVEPTDAGIAVLLVSLGTATPWSAPVVAPSSTVAEIVQRWESDGTTLLMLTAPDGDVQLHGPTSTVTGLRALWDGDPLDRRPVPSAQRG